jgi:tetratricopeptide (TPR) repeat protein
MCITVGLIIISDVLVLSFLSNFFWLTIFFTAVFIFRSEIRDLLGSLSSFSIAGGRFELKDRKSTLESYRILSSIFLDLLSEGSIANELVRFFSEANAERLGKFTLKYATEVKREDMNLALLRNVAFILSDKGNVQDSLAIYDSLIEIAPNDYTFRNDRAVLLLDTDPSKAKKEYESLLNDFPGFPVFRYNLALADILLDNFDDSIKGFRKAIDDGYLPDIDRQSDRAWIQYWNKLANAKPKEFQELRDLLKQRKGQAEQRQASYQEANVTESVSADNEQQVDIKS